VLSQVPGPWHRWERAGNAPGELRQPRAPWPPAAKHRPQMPSEYTKQPANQDTSPTRNPAGVLACHQCYRLRRSPGRARGLQDGR